MPEPLIDGPDMQELLKKAKAAGLAESEARRPLFARIQDVRARLSEVNIPYLQLVNDLTALNEYASRQGQIPPLIVWLENAIVIAAGTDEEEFFQELVDRYHPGEPAGPAAAASAEPTALPEYKEAITFRDDMVPFGYLQGGVKAGLSVARLLVPRFDDGVPAQKGYWGTAWLISDTLLMTNHHVLNARDKGEQPASDADFTRQAQETEIQFDYNSEDAASPVIKATGIGLSDPGLDFAILQIERQPGRSALPVRKTPLKVGKKDYVALNIIQHPRGGPKKIALRNNLATATTNTDVRYFTDTLPGSSGSPVFDDDWNVVALHRGSTAVAGVKFQGRTTAVLNVGTLIHVIVKNLNARP